MFTVECEIHTATGETVTKTVSCRTQQELEKIFELAKNCGHRVTGYKRTFEEEKG